METGGQQTLMRRFDANALHMALDAARRNRDRNVEDFVRNS